MAEPVTTPCPKCESTGLEPVFEHVTFPAHAPEQRHTVVEPHDPNRWPWRWEEGGTCHRLYRSHRICGCEAGRLRLAAERERSQRETSQGRQRGGWR